MDKQEKIINVNSIFGTNFLNSMHYYMYCFQKVPCITYVLQVNTEKVLKYLRMEYGETIIGTFQNSEFNRKKKKTQYLTTIVLLKDNCMVELYGNCCEVLHTQNDYDIANKLIKEVSKFRRREKKKKFEINLITRGEYGLELKAMEIKKTKLDLRLYYEDDFVVTDKLIQSRLMKKDDKGIVLLHGLPGTGKTTYLRYLIGRLKKKVLFLTTTGAANLTNPEFMELLIENPNSIVIIEDAENIIMDRKLSGESSVSNLLNISDGLLADFLNMQLICTFNSPVTLVDQALMRKGRLIAKYEFAKLSVSKAQSLSKHLGFETVINKPMTIAEIAHQHEVEHKEGRIEIVGFKRKEEWMN